MCLFDSTNVLYDDGSPNTVNFTTVEQMQQFDRKLLSGIVDNLPSLSYKMKESSGLRSIAITQSGIALVEVDLVQKIGVNSEKKLFSFLLKISFGVESDKIRSISIIPFASSRTIHGVTNFGQSSDSKMGQNLEEQMSYPSVISLDVEKDNRRSANELEEKRYRRDDGVGLSF